MSLLDKILKKNKKEKLICQRCKKEITTPAYVLIEGKIITNSTNPKVFVCPEQAFNYAQKIIMHDTCWIQTLKELGSPIYDMGKVREKYNKRNKK